MNFTVILQGPYLDPEIPYPLYVFDVTVNAVSALTTIIANSLIMVALKKIPLVQVHAVFKAFLFNLALADLAVGLVVQPAYISAVLTAMYGYPNASRILGTLFYVENWYFANMNVSFLTAIAIDRLLALHLRRRYRNVVSFKKVAIALVFLWILKSAETVILIFDHRIYNILVNAGLGVCITVITFCYLKIYLTLRRHDFTVRDMRMFPLQSADGTCRQREITCVRIGHFNLTRYKRSVRDMLYLYGAFVFCYLPPFCVLLVKQVRGVDRATHIVRFLGTTLVFINSSLNPLLYCWRIREIRRMVRRTIRNLFCK